ncbi:unnamed protein product [Cyclocybe aegerita]|uniref:Uncharacterized protein n=1 Tax=Cyclocybe aegerita TaxID=1973307 RepID=A0A8S0VX23_CYCAE|nr:unnamed protein product [Cyclocybe aegerita]
MGSLCSKSSNHEGGHTVLGSEPSGQNTVGGARTAPANARTAAAEAAERRLQAAQRRGTNNANPNAGKLAGQLAKQNSSKPATQAREEERLVVRSLFPHQRAVVYQL